MLGICAGLGTAAFIGYCFYFDRRRRADPDFKKKLREKRRAAAKRASHHQGPQLPNFSDQEAVQRFFLQEVQLGEELLAQGDVENGVEHLSLAVAVCGQPHSLLGVLQQTLPPQIYKLLLQNLDLAQERIRSHVTSSVTGLQPGPTPSAANADPANTSGGNGQGGQGGSKEAMNEEDVE